jgi:asparagine synthase (glutamine-hydrolysing)
MCGLLFQIDNKQSISDDIFLTNLNKMEWRGPDAQKIHSERDGSVKLGHCRLSVLDPVPRSDQPMVSSDNRFVILFNGEIYNHLTIRERLNLVCRTNSDTETIVEAFSIIGERIFTMLDGMFALVIYDRLAHKWVACRDSFGIKPLYISQSSTSTIIASEPSVIAGILGAELCETSLTEWQLARRPVPGYSFFKGVDEILPGSLVCSDGRVETHWQWRASDEVFCQERFEELLRLSVKSHELSDVSNVSLISGGLDSAVILALSQVKKAYTVGLTHNNEFDGATETSGLLGRDITKIQIDAEELKSLWRLLTKLRGEPLGLPNEALIYSVCKSMLPSEKVVLTGEGADEILFGYDNIFRWACNRDCIKTSDFLERYGYSSIVPTIRLVEYIETLMAGKKPIDFIEDFFYQFHLPGLLRRMDFSSMAASKESRVPFVTKSLIGYCYRQHASIKINDKDSKLPLRAYASKLGLQGALQRKKIGFSAQINANSSRRDEYDEFQSVVMEALR